MRSSQKTVVDLSRKLKWRLTGSLVLRHIGRQMPVFFRELSTVSFRGLPTILSSHSKTCNISRTSKFLKFKPFEESPISIPKLPYGLTSSHVTLKSRTS